jgi:3-methyladenine DNA glycosylase/8-oxoguanine DNA glycosylase
MHLTARPPFSFPAVVHSHGWRQLHPFAWDDQNERLTYLLELPTGRVTRLTFSAAADGLEVQVEPQLTQGEMEYAVRAARWIFGLDLDLQPFYTLARQEPKLAHVPETARGRVLRSATLFEDVVKTILTTNTQWGGTKRMVRGLVENFGAPLDGDTTSRAFPSPARLAELSREQIEAAVKLGYRTPYVLELARRVASGELELEALKDAGLPTDELRKELLRIKGVGGYAAANLLMILGHYDAIPIDSWAHKLVSQEFYGGEPVTPAQIEAVFAPWGEYKGLAYWFWQWETA